MFNDLHRATRRAGQSLLGIVVAMPVAVLAGLVTVFLMDAVLPHGKGWQLPTICLGAFISAGVTGIACMRAIGPRAASSRELDVEHPLDKT
jgi:hypothetical protein